MTRVEQSILIVHPNCELYGSDRVLIQTIDAIRERFPDAWLTIVLPSEGVLADYLRERGADVQVEDLWVPRRARWSATFKSLLRLAPRIVAARRRMAAYDLTFINTLVVFDYMLASRFSPKRTILHIHEILTGRERAVFGKILAWTRARYVFISQAVRDTFPELANRPGAVIWNGVSDWPAVLLAETPRLNVLLIGRFNAWKGQGLLLDAIKQLTRQQRDMISVRLVGGVFAGADHFLDTIRSRLVDEGLQDTVEIADFDPHPDKHYQWAHVVIVPSIKPEPFGLVSIEAMACGRAVIAADHGGLGEIVEDGVTGLRFPPGDARALAGAIGRYIDAPALVASHGAGGRQRYEVHFCDDVYRRKIADFVEATFQDKRP